VPPCVQGHPAVPIGQMGPVSTQTLERHVSPGSQEPPGAHGQLSMPGTQPPLSPAVVSAPVEVAPVAALDPDPEVSELSPDPELSRVADAGIVADIGAVVA
jgi:hypothetical protein